jgi:hypothetical protein
MSDERPTNGQRAALALAAVGLYAEPGTADLPSEMDFFLEYQRDALPGGDQDRLAGLLTGLMHYTERRDLSFEDALTGARQEYHRQQTAYTPGTAVRRAGPASSSPDPDDRPMIGEVISARSGRPAEYLVDFITSREWLLEPELTPAPHFPVLTTAYGTFSTAYAAQHVVARIVREAEKAHLEDRLWGSDAIIDLDRALAALSGWSGLRRDTLLQTFGEVISEQDGMIIAGAQTSHPVGLAAASAPIPPYDAAPALTADLDARDAVVSPLRNPAPRTQAGPR